MKIDTSDLRKVADQLQDGPAFMRAMKPWVSLAGMDMLGHIKAEAPHRSGRLAAATDFKVDEDLDLTFYTPDSVPYAQFVYGGTRAHDVNAKPGGMLVFLGTGGPVFRKHVHIPAIPANPYIDESIAKHLPEFNKIVEDGMEIVIQKEVQV